MLVTKCFKVSQTLHARCVFNQFLLESITWTKKRKMILSLKRLTLHAQRTRTIGHVHQHAHVFSFKPPQTLIVDNNEVS